MQIVASNVTYLKIDLNTLQGTNVLQTSIPYAQQVQIQTGTVVPGTYQLTVYDQNEAVLFSKKVVKAPRSLRQ
ncbi:MAG: hypothetical protein IPK99_11235 [Flavobacteriales bacterium]|nr:hypothetical protein [Flavobacteriales bacterium]